MTSRGAAAAAGAAAASAAAWQVVNSVTRCHLWQWPSQAMAMQAQPSQAGRLWHFLNYFTRYELLQQVSIILQAAKMGNERKAVEAVEEGAGGGAGGAGCTACAAVALH